MNYHIIKPGDTIESISKLYNVSKSEIMNINPHFRSWENLAPGAKLRIPEIPEFIRDELEEVDPFIEDYYPKINIEEIISNKNIESSLTEEIKTNKNENTKTTLKKTIPYYYYPYYGYYNAYSYQRKRK